MMNRFGEYMYVFSQVNSLGQNASSRQLVKAIFLLLSAGMFWQWHMVFDGVHMPYSFKKHYLWKLVGPEIVSRVVS